MEYTVKALAELTGVSARTLRYYDQIDLLKPNFRTEAGYRVYGEQEVDLLQQILFYRTLGMDLATIKQTVHHSDFDVEKALMIHYQSLLQKKAAIDDLLHTVEQTIAYRKGEREMTNQEKFEAFKSAKLSEHEQEFGKQSRELYGEEVDIALEKWQGMSQIEYEEMQKTEQKLCAVLKKAAVEMRVDSTEAKTVYELHRKWLMYSWKDYSAARHIGVTRLYLMDDRFLEYYKTAGNLSKEEVELLVQIIETFANEERK